MWLPWLLGPLNLQNMRIRWGSHQADQGYKTWCHPLLAIQFWARYLSSMSLFPFCNKGIAILKHRVVSGIKLDPVQYLTHCKNSINSFPLFPSNLPSLLSWSPMYISFHYSCFITKTDKNISMDLKLAYALLIKKKISSRVSEELGQPCLTANTT